MWVMVMFDLPSKTSKERRNYAYFRKLLLQDGFVMLQYSVYSRHCPSDENSLVHKERIRSGLPHDGEVRILSFTDKQYGKMIVYYGGKRKTIEKAPEQITLF